MEMKSAAIDDGDDRLSSLPDGILCRILSLLQTKHAVATSVLSSRWKDLWTRVSILDLETPWISAPGDLISRCQTVERVLSRHENLNSLKRFRLHFPVAKRIDCGGAAIPNFWARMQKELGEASQLEEVNVVGLGTDDYGVMNMGIEDHFSVLRWLPESFFTLKNLKVLKLVAVRISSGAIFALPNLKLLQLSGLNAADSEPISRLISGCPVLETLNMQNCCAVESRSSSRELRIRITACLPSLRNLSIFGGDDFDSLLCPVAIEAPSLEHLYLDDVGEVLELVGDGTLPCLDLARVDITVGCGGYMNGDVDWVIRLLARISNAKELSLSQATLEFLSRRGGMSGNVQLPVFPKLAHLTMDGGETSCLLHLLLNSASRLQSLVIVLEEAWDEEEYLSPFWQAESVPACVPECLSSSLEEIEVHNLLARGIDDGMKVVAYLLEVGVVLKKVNLCIKEVNQYDDGTGEDCRLAVASLLQKLPRGSSACEARLLVPDDDDGCRTKLLLKGPIFRAWRARFSLPDW